MSDSSGVWDTLTEGLLFVWLYYIFCPTSSPQWIKLISSRRHLDNIVDRCCYECVITEEAGAPLFVITVKEPGHEDLVLKDITPKDVWSSILRTIADNRLKRDCVKIFPEYLSGEYLYGLKEAAIIRIVESVCAPSIHISRVYHFTLKYQGFAEFAIRTDFNHSVVCSCPALICWLDTPSSSGERSWLRCHRRLIQVAALVLNPSSGLTSESKSGMPIQ